MDHDSKQPGWSAKAPQPGSDFGRIPTDPSLPFPTRLNLQRSEPGTIDLRGTSILGSNARLRMPLARLLDLAELAVSWLGSRQRWAGYSLGPSGDLRFPPASPFPEPASSDPRVFADRAAKHRWVPCFDETVLGWDVTGALVSGHDEAVGALVAGPGASVTLLSRGALVLIPRPPEDPLLFGLASASLVRPPCELARFRLSSLRNSSLVLEPGHVTILESLAGEFSSLRRIVG